jgi:hypothetical protein
MAIPVVEFSREGYKNNVLLNLYSSTEKESKSFV